MECVTDKILCSERLTSQKKKFYCDSGPDHSILDLSEECVVGGRRLHKTFQASWYDKFPWLTVSREKRTFFCFSCMLFSNEKSVWTKDGYRGIKKLYDHATKHGKTRKHRECSLDLKVFQRSKPITALLDQQKAEELSRHNKQVSANREFLKRLIDIVTFLGTHEISFRGHDEKVSSDYRGNYIDFIYFTASIDARMKMFLDHNNIFKGTSATIQNDIIKSVSSVIQERIRNEIQNSDFVSIQVDETSDLSNREFLSIVIRYVVDGAPVERFLGFFQVKDRTASGLFNVVKNAIEMFECDPKKIINITCDGASVMSGRIGGLGQKMKELNEDIIFVHCHAHRLSLVISDAVRDLTPCRIFFSSLTAFRSFFKHSTKRNDTLHEFAETNNLKQKSIPSLPETRWTFGTRTVSTIINLREVLKQALEHMRTSEDFKDTAYDARGLLQLLNDEEFIFMCILWKKIFATLDILSNTYQKVEVDVVKCCYQFRSCVEHLTEMKSDHTFSTMLSETKRMHYNSDLYNLRHSEDFFSKTFESCLDKVICHLNYRFSDMGLLKPFMLFDISMFEKYSKVPGIPRELLESASYFLRSVDDLETELRVLYRNKQIVEQCTSACDLLKIVSQEFSDIFPQCKILLSKLVTTSASSCGCERSFSALKRIKSYLRTSMTNERLTNLSTISIEKAFLVTECTKDSAKWYDDIISTFCSINERRVDFLYK